MDLEKEFEGFWEFLMDDTEVFEDGQVSSNVIYRKIKEYVKKRKEESEQ